MDYTVALACSWACHNLNEVQAAIFDYMDGKEPMLPGPDFPTGGIIINKNDIPNIMRTGKGTVRIRAKYEVKKNIITITEIPYGTTVEGLLNEISDFCDENPQTGIKEITDQTDIKGVRIIIECDTSSNPNSIIQKLFAKTNLQSSFSYNQVALVNKIPTEMNLKDCCKVYVEHNIECIVREAEFDKLKASDRLHIVNGLLKALEDIDNIISLIKKSDSGIAAKDALIEKYKFSEAQAKAILAMRLSSLASLEKIELQNEAAELNNTIEQLNALINNSDIQRAELRARLSDIVKKFGDARRTELIQLETSKEDKEIEFVEPEKCVVVMTESGMIKRIPTTSFKTQKRNGKGVKTQDDIVDTIIRTNTVDNLMIFTNKGKMYRLLVNDIPAGTNTSKGQYIKALVEMEANEEPQVIYSIYRDTDAQYVLFATKNGLVKKTALEEYVKTKKKNGIAAITIKEDDELVSVSLIKDENIILITNNGMMIRFNSKDISPSARATSGVKGITLNKGDSVCTCLAIRDSNDKLAIFSGNGQGKKISMSEVPAQSRAGKGLLCYKPTAATGNVSSATLVSDEDNILVVGDKKSICIPATEIPELGRASLGNIIIKDSKIKSVSKV